MGEPADILLDTIDLLLSACESRLISQQALVSPKVA
jgi:hypothetical protein